MISAGLGTSLFTLPSLCDRVGILPLLGYLLAGACFSYYSMVMIGRCFLNRQVRSFSHMAQTAAGSGFRACTEAAVLLFVLGTAVCYLVFVSDIVATQLAPEAGKLESVRKVLVLMLALAGTACCLFERQARGHLDLLQRCCVPLTFALLFGAFFSTACFGYERTPLSVPPLAARRWDLAWAVSGQPAVHLNVFAMTLFCYMNHFVLFSVLGRMKQPCPASFTRIFRLVHCAELLLAGALALGGYALLHGHAEIKLLIVDSIDSWPFLLTKCCLCLVLFANLTIYQASFAETLAECLAKEHRLPEFKLAFVWGSCLIAFFYKNVMVVLGLVGGVAGTIILGAAPALCYMILEGVRPPFVVLAYSLLTLCGFAGAVSTLLL